MTDDSAKVGPTRLRQTKPTAEEAELLALLSDPNVELAKLAASWRSFVDTGRAGRLPTYQLASKTFLDKDAGLLAFDAASAGLEHWSNDLELRRRQGLALARIGAVERANELASSLQREGIIDDESRGLLARTHKDLALIAREPQARDRHLSAAFEIYNATYQNNGNYWHGINAATLSVLRGDFPGAMKLAAEICKQINPQLRTAKGAERYWILATLAEAALIRRRWKEALDFYKKAVKGAQPDQVATTRKQARLLMNHLQSDSNLRKEDCAAIEACFDLPRVVVFVGHMVDRGDRGNERLPDDLTGAVGAKISEELEKLGKVVGYSSAACGSDILFLEAVAATGGETHVVLPYDQEDFARDSVAFAGAHWRKRFDQVLTKAVATRVVSPHQKLSWGSVSYDYANLVLTGMALSHAKQLDTEFITLAVWDGKEGDGGGGTASVVKRWQERHEQKVVIIDPAKVMKEAKYKPRRSSLSVNKAFVRHTALNGATHVRATMFVDVVESTKLTEEQMPAFVEHFLYQIGAMAAVSPDRPIVQESRGDGVFLAFDSIAKAGRFALDVCERLRSTKWIEYDLPAEFRVRIGLHAGPVYHFLCPFTKQLSFTGHHVNRAARIEAITLGGEVYASQEFTALACEEQIDDFHCEYAGLVALPKKYGTFPIYHLRQRR